MSIALILNFLNRFFDFDFGLSMEAPVRDRGSLNSNARGTIQP